LSKSKKVTTEKATQVIKVKSNFREKNLFSLTANISPLLASNTVECCKERLLCTETTQLSLDELNGRS